MEPFLRYKKFGVRPIQNGLMIAARYEHLDETSPASGGRRLTIVPDRPPGKDERQVLDARGQLLDISKRFRATFN